MGTVLKYTTMAPVDTKLTTFTANVHETNAVKTRPSMKTLDNGNGNKIYKPWPLSTQN